MPKNCILCWTQLANDPIHRGNDNKWWVACAVCGHYLVDGDFSVTVAARHSDSHLLSGAVREMNESGISPSISSFEELLSAVRIPRNPLEKMDRLMLSISRTQNKMGVPKQFVESDYPLAYAQDFGEFVRIVETLRKMGLFVDYNQSNEHGELSYQGWKRVVEMSKSVPISDQAFVAMSFSPEFDPLYDEGIRPALLETGYRPLRVDKTEHNEKIDDYILAQIKKSGLLVVDFTGQNAGAYFEAGFAMSLGLNVIRTCRNDEYGNLHFDTRQYPHIGWENPQDLKKKLIYRIYAVAPIKTSV